MKILAFKVLSGDQAPRSFRTISEFQISIQHAFFKNVFFRILHLALQLKMVIWERELCSWMALLCWLMLVRRAVDEWLLF